MSPSGLANATYSHSMKTNDVSKFGFLIFSAITLYEITEFRDLTAPIKIHEGIDFWVGDYMKWHAQNRHNASRRAIYRPVAAGLGDNIKGMLNLYAYSVLTDRLFLVPGDGFNSLKPFLSESVLKQFMYNASYDEKKASTVFISNTQKQLSTKNKRVLAGSAENVFVEVGPVKFNRPSDDHVVSSLRKGRRMIQNVPLFSQAVRRAVTHTIFQPSNYLYKAYVDIARDISVLNRPYVAVHARLGLGVGELGKFERRFKGKFETAAKCFSSEIKKFETANSIRDTLVYIATDTSEFIPVFERVMAKSFLNTRVIHMNAKPMHYDHIRKRGGKNTLLYLNIHLESLLIGHAMHIISFSSGFADVSFWRGNATSHKILEYAQCGLGA